MTGRNRDKRPKQSPVSGQGTRRVLAARAARWQNSRRNRYRLLRSLVHGTAAIAAAWLAGGAVANAQYYYGPWGQGGYWSQCATADEAYLTGWSRVFRAWGEANYLNALASCGYQQAGLMGLENRGRFLSPYVPQSYSQVGPAALGFAPEFLTAEATVDRDDPRPRVAPRSAPARSTPPRDVYPSVHAGRGSAEQERRQRHYQQNFEARSRRQLAVQLAAEKLAAQIEAADGQVPWPKLLTAKKYADVRAVVERCVRQWRQSYALSAQLRGQWRASLKDVHRELARRQFQQPSDSIAEARDFLNQVDAMLVGPSTTSAALATK